MDELFEWSYNVLGNAMKEIKKRQVKLKSTTDAKSTKALFAMISGLRRKEEVRAHYHWLLQATFYLLESKQHGGSD